MPRMPSRLIGIPSRLAFALCGLVSVLLGRMYVALGGLYSASSGRWSLFSAALMAVGGLAVFIALLPDSWAKKAFKVEPDKSTSSPVKMLAGFAIISYFVVVGLSLAPRSWHPGPQFVFSLCPACALAITVDPSLATVLLFLAPLSAAVYGSLGGVLGYISVLIRKSN
jgi:hypothetical protein